MTLSQAAEAARARVKADPRLNDHGRRVEFSRVMAVPVRDAAHAYRAAAQRARDLREQAAAAREAVRAKQPPVSEALQLELARLAREVPEYRDELSSLVMAARVEGASLTEEQRTHLTALATAVTPRLFGLTRQEQSAARALLDDALDSDPAVATIRAEADAAALEARQLRAQLRSLEPELDRDELAKAGALVRGPYDLPEAESHAWMLRDPEGWAMAAANRDAFTWADPRDELPAAA